jgi:hypothetical protein
MARLKTVGEAPSLGFYRQWSTARDESKEKSTELGEIVKEATDELAVDKGAFKLACKLKRQDPIKAAAFLRGFNQLVAEFGIDAQTDLEDAIKNTEAAA